MSSTSSLSPSKSSYSSPVSSAYTTRVPVYSTAPVTSSPLLSYIPEPAATNKLSSLRNENTELVSQSERLLKELESTSTQLSVAKRKIHTLENKSITDPTNITSPSHPTVYNSSPSHPTVYNSSPSHPTMYTSNPSHPTVYTSSPSHPSPSHNSLSYKNSTDAEWNSKHKTLSDQLANVQEECQRLKDACIDAEQRTNKRKKQQLYDRPVSSQSWRGIPTASSTYPSFSRYYDPPTAGIGRSHSDYTTTMPITTTNSINSYKPFDSGLDRSLSGSNTSLCSIKSAREPLTYASNNHSLIKSTYSSIHGNGQNSLVELEKSKSKIRKLEKQVSILEKQLIDKSKLSEGHVEELTKLRSLLAQEKSTNAINTHQTQEKAASEIGRLRALNMEQNSELQAQLTKLKGVKNKLENELEESRVTLKGCQDENRLLSDRASKLLSQLEEERSTQRSSLERLKHKADNGQWRVNELETELKTCQTQLNNCMRDIETEKERKDNDHIRLDQQIIAFSSQLQNCQTQLSSAYTTIQELNGHLEEKEREIKGLRENEEEKRIELMKQLKQNNNNRDTLLRQLETANNEIMILTQRNTVLQESTLTTRQLEGEVLQLRKSLTDQQHVRMELQQTKEEFETEVGRVKNENGIMKDRLKQSSLQLSDMQHRSEEWRNDRERITKRNKELQTELDKTHREMIGLKNHLQQYEHNHKAKDSTNNASLQHLQQELTKRTEQVIDMDTLLRSQRTESVTKTHEYEMKLAKKEEDMRIITKEHDRLSERFEMAQKTIEELETTVNDQSDDNTELKQKNDLINILELKIKKKDDDLKSLKEKKTANRKEIARLGGALAKAKTHQDNSDSVASRDQQITRLGEQIQQLLQQERMKQEEVSRCRAQVVSLSTELAVEREMVQETRQQLAQERASHKYSTPSSPTTPTLTTPTSLYKPPITSKTSQILAQNSNNSPLVNHTNHNNIIHI